MTELQRQIWDARIDAKTNTTYYQRLAWQYRVANEVLSLASLLVGSAAVASWIVNNASQWVPWLTLATVVVGAIQRVFEIGAKTAILDHACERWGKQERAWDILWLRVHEEPGAVGLPDYVRLRDADPPHLEWKFSRRRKLVWAAQQEVWRSEGLKRRDEEHGKAAWWQFWRLRRG